MNLFDYRQSFLLAVILHIILVLLLFLENYHARPVLQLASKQQPAVSQQSVVQPTNAEIIHSVSVDSTAVMKAVENLKQERAQQRQTEKMRQLKLNQRAALAQQKRVLEENRLNKLKQETAQFAIAKKKQIEQEQVRMKRLEMQKAQELKTLAELQQHQEMVKKSIAAKEAQAAKMAQEAKAIETKAAAQSASKSVKASVATATGAKTAVAKAANPGAAQLDVAAMGEINKYKAMIIDAISRQWILPDNVNQNLSSQFRIRLSQNGTVLEVHLIRSSGDAILDRSAQTAIYKASPLPVPHDQKIFNLFREISLTVRPETIRG